MCPCARTFARLLCKCTLTKVAVDTRKFFPLATCVCRGKANLHAFVMPIRVRLPSPSTLILLLLQVVAPYCSQCRSSTFFPRVLSLFALSSCHGRCRACHTAYCAVCKHSQMVKAPLSDAATEPTTVKTRARCLFLLL